MVQVLYFNLHNNSNHNLVSNKIILIKMDSINSIKVNNNNNKCFKINYNKIIISKCNNHKLECFNKISINFNNNLLHIVNKYQNK